MQPTQPGVAAASTGPRPHPSADVAPAQPARPAAASASAASKPGQRRNATVPPGSRGTCVNGEMSSSHWQPEAGPNSGSRQRQRGPPAGHANPGPGRTARPRLPATTSAAGTGRAPRRAASVSGCRPGAQAVPRPAQSPPRRARGVPGGDHDQVAGAPSDPPVARPGPARLGRRLLGSQPQHGRYRVAGGHQAEQAHHRREVGVGDAGWPPSGERGHGPWCAEQRADAVRDEPIARPPPERRAAQPARLPRCSRQARPAGPEQRAARWARPGRQSPAPCHAGREHAARRSIRWRPGGASTPQRSPANGRASPSSRAATARSARPAAAGAGAARADSRKAGPSPRAMPRAPRASLTWAATAATRRRPGRTRHGQRGGDAPARAAEAARPAEISTASTALARPRSAAGGQRRVPADRGRAHQLEPAGLLVGPGVPDHQEDAHQPAPEGGDSAVPPRGQRAERAAVQRAVERDSAGLWPLPPRTAPGRGVV